MSTEPGLDDVARPVRSRFGAIRQWPDWLVLLPLTLLVASVAVLAVYTTVVNLQVMAVRKETIVVTVPALRAAQDLMTQVAMELEGLYQYTLRGDPVALSNYRESAAARRVAATALAPLALEVRGDSRALTEDLLRLVRQWDAMAPDPTILAGLGADPRERYLRDAQLLYRSILLQAAAVQDALRLDIDESIAWADEADRLAWYFTLGLAALTFTAFLLVRWLVRRVRGLADESRRRRLEAERAMEHRSLLIRGITHDLKNPLAAADGSAQLFEMGLLGSLTEKQQANVGRIRRSIGSALGIISDMLELNRAEAGGLKMEISPTDVAPILDEAVEDERSEAETAGLTMQLDVPAGLPRVLADGGRVRQIVGNLLSNAVKYTPAGGRVTLSAGIRSGAATPPGGRWLAISVADTGPGIPSEEHERIFEEFYRSDAVPARSTGVGLGLTISRRIARLLSGDLTVESEPGQGSVFTLWLPLEDAARDRVA